MAEHAHAHGQEHEEAIAKKKLRLISSPVVGEKSLDSETSSLTHQRSGPDGVDHLGFRDAPGHVCPEFMRHEEATNVELFFDLFFAANLTVFSEVHETTDSSKLSSYIGYFCMLWLTWALVGLFDVRFVTDSVFERLARSVHLGVMIGFAVVAPFFNPDEQDPATFRAMSLILMVSRLTLAAQYSTIIWHVRSYRTTRLPLALMVGIHFVAAMVYLGLTFTFNGENSNSYITWYVIAVIELLLNIGLSLFWDVLSFRETHLINRMSLLTLIIIGEGIIVIANNVTVVVKNPDAWTPATIGVVVASVGTVYIVYQIYFDWKRHLHLPPKRQLIWVFLHFPFHLALTLFVEGSSQFILFWKIMEVLQSFSDLLDQSLAAADSDSFNVTTSWFVDQLNSTIQDIFNQGYSPKYYDTSVDISEGLQKLRTLPDSFWASSFGPDEDSATFNESWAEVYDAVQNSLFASFNIDSIGDAAPSADGAEFEADVSDDNVNRFWLVFIYTFAAAGCVLILLNILYIISRYGRDRWGAFNYARAAINFVFGFGLAFIPLLALNPDDAANYYTTPWILPTLLLVFFSALILNHLPHPPPFFFSKRRRSSARPNDAEDGLDPGLPTVERNSEAADVRANGEQQQPEQRDGSIQKTPDAAVAYGETTS